MLRLVQAITVSDGLPAEFRVCTDNAYTDYALEGLFAEATAVSI